MLEAVGRWMVPSSFLVVLSGAQVVVVAVVVGEVVAFVMLQRPYLVVGGS